jgi:hypothetical protein
MDEQNRPVYCPRCGSIVQAGDSFCGVCGARITSDAQDATPTQEIPTVVEPPPVVPPRRRNRTWLLGIAAGVVVVLLLAGAGALALTDLNPVAGLLGEAGGDGSSSGAQHPSQTPSKPATTSEVQPGTTSDSKENGEGNVASEKGSEPLSGTASEPAPGYTLIQTPDESLSVEVPPSWGVETGEDSEKQAGSNTWSYYAEEYLTSSISTAPNLDAWYSTGTSGAYIVASKALAQYTDDELIHSLLYANKDQNCTKGPYKDYDRSPYSGKIQTWYDCGADSATTYTIAASPEGRKCVVVVDARISKESDRKDVEHLIDTFKVDCSRVTTRPLASSPNDTSSSASPASSAPPSASPGNTSNQTVENVDWSNTQYTTDCGGVAPKSFSVEVQNGEGYTPASDTTSFRGYSILVESVAIGDLTGDGSSEAAVLLACSPKLSNFSRGEVQVFTDGASGPQLLAKLMPPKQPTSNFDLPPQFTGNPFVVRSGQLVTGTVYWVGDDPHCCPSTHRILSWQWNGSQFVASGA